MLISLLVTTDNPVHVHFSHNECVVKDKSTGQSLVIGMANQGMYPVMPLRVADSVSPIPQVLVVAAVSSSKLLSKEEFYNWHYKLGHPSDKVLKQILH